MKIGNDEILMLYTLLDNRELGEYLPLPVLTQRAGLPANEAKAVALSLERAGLIACEVDAHLAEDAKYKYALTPVGLSFMQEVLRPKPKKGLIHKPRRPG